MPEDMRKFMGLIVLTGQVRKESVRDYWSTDPTISTPIFLQTMSRNQFESIWQAWNFSVNSQQAKYSQCMSTLYRNLGQCTAQSKNCCLMKPWSHGGVAWHLEHIIQGKKPNMDYWWEWCVRQYLVTSVTWRYTQLRGKVAGHSVITVGKKLGPQSPPISDNFYNSVKLAETLLDRNVRVSGTMRANGHFTWPGRGRSATRYICKFCIVPIHKGSCFEKYHTLRNY
jgi:hypothetical protein